MPESLYELPSGAFRFELGLRRGNGTFFRHTEDDAPLLAERSRWLTSDPERYAAAMPGSERLIEEAVAFAQAKNPGLPVTAPNPAALGRVWAPDFLLMARDGEGSFSLRAGCVCFPTYWDLGEKMGRPMAAIHAPVPTLNENLSRQVDGFLVALRPGATWERWNWGLTASPERNNHPALALPRLTPETSLDEMWLRVEHQAFVGLESGVLFGIRLVIEPLREAVKERAAAERLAHLLETMPEAVAEYKGVGAVRERLVAELRDGLV